MVWRDRGEPVVEVHDLWECLEHGIRGGLRTSHPAPSFCSREEMYHVFFRGRDSRLCDSFWRQPHPSLGPYPARPEDA
jgi:hypothetical protein